MNRPLKIGPLLVNPDLNEILREGQPVKVEPQVMKLLVFLSGHPGELLTRREILHGVWDGTSVSDDALKRAIRVLRRALGDDASQPRFIETLPKKGYRLIAPVSSGKRPLRLRHIATRLVAAAALAGGYLLLRDGPVPTFNPHPTVTVLPFDNLAEDLDTEWLRVGLADMLITDLAQSPYLEVPATATSFSASTGWLNEAVVSAPAEYSFNRLVTADWTISGSSISASRRHFPSAAAV